MEEVRRLTVIGIGNAQVQRQVVSNLVIVAEVEESVVLTEIQVVVTERDPDPVRRVQGK